MSRADMTDIFVPQQRIQEFLRAPLKYPSSGYCEEGVWKRKLRVLRAKRLLTDQEDREAETAQIMSGGDETKRWQEPFRAGAQERNNN